MGRETWLKEPEMDFLGDRCGRNSGLLGKFIYRGDAGDHGGGVHRSVAVCGEGFGPHGPKPQARASCQQVSMLWASEPAAR